MEHNCKSSSLQNGLQRRRSCYSKGRLLLRLLKGVLFGQELLSALGCSVHGEVQWESHPSPYVWTLGPQIQGGVVQQLPRWSVSPRQRQRSSCERQQHQQTEAAPVLWEHLWCIYDMRACQCTGLDLLVLIVFISGIFFPISHMPILSKHFWFRYQLIPIYAAVWVKGTWHISLCAVVS